MGNSFRSDRVAVEIQREINDILRNKVRDPRVQNVNITDVQLTGDLSQATVYYSLLSNLASDNEKAATALKKATGGINHNKFLVFRIDKVCVNRITSCSCNWTCNYAVFAKNSINKR